MQSWKTFIVNISIVKKNYIKLTMLLINNKIENPAYGRQRISWPMRIVAPIKGNPLFSFLVSIFGSDYFLLNLTVRAVDLISMLSARL